MFRVLSCLGGEHDLRLVALAGVICFLASVAAISLFHRGQAADGRARLTWVLTAATVTGCGIWATHFIAMLAFTPGVEIAYDLWLTALSLVVAMAATGIGLSIALGRWRWSAALGGAVVGAGIAGMHYTGMAAVQLPARIAWSGDLVFASVALGIAIAIVAMIVASRRDDARSTALAGLVLTLAIVSLHFTAMGALEIVPDPTRVIHRWSLSPTSLALSVANVTLLVLGLGLAAAFIDRLRERDLRLATAVNNLSQGVVMFDAHERVVVCNDRYLEMYRLSPQVVKPGVRLIDLIRHRISTGSLERDAEEYRAELVGAMKQGRTVSWIVDSADGRAISVINKPFAGGYWVGTHEDISERRRAECELQRTKSFLDKVIETVPTTIVVKDAKELRYVLVNRAGERYYGVPSEQLIGKTAYDLFPRATAHFIAESDRELIASGREHHSEPHAIETPGNGTRIVTTTRLPIFGDDGKPQYMLAVIDDLTERKQAEDRIAHMAQHDPLTDLPNRAAFARSLQAALEKAAKAEESFAVMCIDLDRFKEVNDVFGHTCGDDLLREVARRLRDAAGDAVLARVGGDEFTLVGTAGPASAGSLAERLLASVAGDIDVDGQPLRIGLSIGVAIYPGDGTDAATLLGNADAALDRAKAEGRGAIRFFHSTMDQRLRERRALQHDLRSALENSELVLHYQPQAAIEGEVTGFEALIRWRHPTRGLVAPGLFIPVAEESGAIIPIGEWTLREACREAASWPKPLRVSVNLSPVQFRHGDLAALVHSVLLETGLSPGRLELEITEGVLIGDYSGALAILRRLKAMGVRIAMDDFGTGYSSLSYLQAFPFDKIKIDRTFIANLDRNAQSAAIIRAVIGLGRGLNLPVVAEGVETEDQLGFLSREGCDEIQGYLIGRPGPIGDFAAMLQPSAEQPRPVRRERRVATRAGRR
jgi:diguanylate cyclase (GGDEF)-like protein/PAS domain S-box-containing protein